MNDLTVSFNNRENSAKNLQFAGSGPLETITGTPTSVPVAIAGYTKGQFVRLFLSSNNNDTPSKVIASARQLSFHCSLGIEESSTKDTTGTWQYQEATSLSYDISTQALVRGNDTITSEVLANGLNELEEIYEAGNPVRWSICNVSGDNNRTKGSSIVSGSCIISNLQINAQDRTAASYQASLLGYGVYNFGT